MVTVFCGRSCVNWQEGLYIAILNFWFWPLANAMYSTSNVNVVNDPVIESLASAQELSNGVLAVSE